MRARPADLRPVHVALGLTATIAVLALFAPTAGAALAATDTLAGAPRGAGGPPPDSPAHGAPVGAGGPPPHSAAHGAPGPGGPPPHSAAHGAPVLGGSPDGAGGPHMEGSGASSIGFVDGSATQGRPVGGAGVPSSTALVPVVPRIDGGAPAAGHAPALTFASPGISVQAGWAGLGATNRVGLAGATVSGHGLYFSLFDALVAAPGREAPWAVPASASGRPSGGTAPDAPQLPAPSSSAGASGAGVAFSTLFALLFSLAAFAAQRFGWCLQLAPALGRPTAFVAAIERPG